MRIALPPTSRRALPLLAVACLCGFALVWSTPLWWMLVACVRTIPYGSTQAASLVPDLHPTAEHFVDAFAQGDFARWYLNTLIVTLGILMVQLVTITLAGYAFARMEFRGRNLLFYLFLLQLTLAPPILIVPNTLMIVRLGLYDSLPGVMAPYFASAFGVFLMRQTFKTIPRDFEEAAILDGANFAQMIRLVLVPLARPGLIAFSIVSLTSHWNEFLWPLMVTDSPDKMVLTVGLTSFVRSAEQAADWGLVAAATLLVAGPLLIAFALFQRQFVNSFLFTGIK
ncbi:MAG: carbohydrate ABC transporter permease [Hyphomicrobiales bacterium]|nr:carbohydrate ABC transporter permease [Hyphomicrobiales bacterium]MBV9433974.1 carbohydrate ABC transporter permease [Hyphomicrobiales bacterium]MBV9740054.1 carbohydrate ABC transporter permease [Hyphomicrobiales bacterium]